MKDNYFKSLLLYLRVFLFLLLTTTTLPLSESQANIDGLPTGRSGQYQP